MSVIDTEIPFLNSQNRSPRAAIENLFYETVRKKNRIALNERFLAQRTIIFPLTIPLGTSTCRSQDSITSPNTLKGMETCNKAGDRTRTGDVQLGKLAFCHWITPALLSIYNQLFCTLTSPYRDNYYRSSGEVYDPRRWPVYFQVLKYTGIVIGNPRLRFALWTTRISMFPIGPSNVQISLLSNAESHVSTGCEKGILTCRYITLISRQQ